MNILLQRASALLFLPSLLCGCFLGEPALSGRERGRYLDTIQPYLWQWQKAGTTEAERRQYSLQCGTAATPHAIEHVVFDENVIRSAILQGESNQFAAFTRLRHDWERCMLDKGFTFIGECPDNAISRAKPACAAKFRR